MAGDYDDMHTEHDFEEDCPNCGGEGVVYCCHEPWACLDPDEGCADCEQRCDWCRPLKKPQVPSPVVTAPGGDP